jgi:DNA-binding IclR family transcriptional regulator
VLHGHPYGLRESELASELGWQRRTVNNYLRALERRGLAYKEGRDWFIDT